MMTLQWIDLRCPVCESNFESMAALSNNDGGQEYVEPTSPSAQAAMLPFLVHVCRRCGYAGGGDDFGDGIEISDSLRDFVWTRLAPKLGTSVRIPWLALTVAGSEKYEGAAQIAERRGSDARTVAQLWIRAAWCCVDEDDTEAERYYGRFAAGWFATAMDFYGEVHADERAEMAYQLGELWLRIGDTKHAAAWFERVAEEIIDPDLQRGVMTAAQLQIAAAGRVTK